MQAAQGAFIEVCWTIFSEQNTNLTLEYTRKPIISCINQSCCLVTSWSTNFKCHISYGIIIWKVLHFADKTCLLLESQHAKYLAESAKTVANYGPGPRVTEDWVESILRQKAGRNRMSFHATHTHTHTLIHAIILSCIVLFSYFHCWMKTRLQNVFCSP